MLTRFLALNNVKVEFVLADDGFRRSDWSVLTKEAQEKFVDEQFVLAQTLLPSHVAFEKTRREGVQTGLFEDHAVYEILSEAATGGIPSYKVSPSLLDYLYCDSRFEQRSSLLLENLERPLRLPQRAEISSPYVAWHVRKGLWNRERDSSQVAVLRDFQEIREIFPRHSLMIFSSAPGIEFALTALEEYGALEEMKSRGLFLRGQLSRGFINAIPLILESDFYFQRLGGGVGMIPIFSSVPYLMLSADGNYYYRRRGDRLVPWARQDQAFVVDPLSAGRGTLRSYRASLG